MTAVEMVEMLTNEKDGVFVQNISYERNQENEIKWKMYVKRKEED